MRALVIALACALALSCASPGGVGVTLDEFSLTANPSDARAGRVAFRIRNVGEITHEFIVVRTLRAPDRLPIRNQEADLGAFGIRVVARLDGVRPGTERTLRHALPAGRYVLLCNVPAHYSAGMHAPFRVP